MIYVVRSGSDATLRRVLVRARHADGAAVVAVQRALRAVPEVNVGFVTPLLRTFDSMVTARRFIAELFGLLGVLALALAAVGLYGVLAYAVGQRMREFGVRIALGARPANLVRLVFRDGVTMVLAGTAVGALVAMWTANLLAAWLYDVSPTDAASLVAAEAVLLAVSLAACTAPALAAARADPLEVLRAT
jgi:ABC-type antimicrobial peptide transport system permease subunit